MKIVLASKSKWRRNLAEKALNTTVENAEFDFDEKSVIIANKPKTAEEHVKFICKEKLNTARKNLINKEKENEIILCYDTIVVCNDIILEKPKNRNELIKMVKTWGKENIITSIYTGVAIGTLFNNSDSCSRDFNFALKADVKMLRNFTEEEYNKYINDENANFSSGAYIVENLLELKIVEIIQGTIDIIQGLPIEATKNCISSILNIYK